MKIFNCIIVVMWLIGHCLMLRCYARSVMHASIDSGGCIAGVICGSSFDETKDQAMTLIKSQQTRSPSTRAAINNITWPKAELLEIARLIDRLQPPNYHRTELYFEQKSALAHELRRLAARYSRC